MEHGGIEEICRTRQFPGIRGLSSGRGSGSAELAFNKPDLAKEMKHTMKAMEDNGQLKDPRAMHMAKTLVDHAESQPPDKTDYQHTGIESLDRD